LRKVHANWREANYLSVGQIYLLANLYQPATRVYKGLPDVDYPFHDKVIVVTNCGRICLGHKK
jgi:hypothetical protein